MGGGGWRKKERDCARDSEQTGSASSAALNPSAIKRDINGVNGFDLRGADEMKSISGGGNNCP